MEYLVFWGCAFVFIAAVVIKGIALDRRKQKEFEESLRRTYGQLKEREYGADRFERMDRYFRRHPEKDQLDDITWNDLGMDEIFKSMNHTYSAVGEEYLYFTLRNVGCDPDSLEHFEELVRFFSEHEEQRVYLQLRMAKLGYMGKYSLYDYLENLDYLGERSNRKAHICNALILLFVILIPFQLFVSLCGIAVLLIYNIMRYFKEKGEIEPYIISFRYLLKLMNVCGELEKIPLEDADAVRGEIEEMSRSRKKLQGISRGASLLLSGGGVIGGNPLEIVMDYIRMIFHVDLIQFNRMLKTLRENTDQVDRMVTAAGKLETAVSTGAWRKGLWEKEGYCIPEFFESGQTGMTFRLEQGYHPLLTNPVKNSVETDRGVLLTGSNASGKSTFLKTCAVNAILAQTVHTCTAESYRAPVVRIYTSMALRDDLSGGDSYYIVEIKALKRILNAAAGEGRPVLCFVDEVLRGTNTVERIAASTQILKSLRGDRVLCFAATHDIELTDLLAQVYDNYHFKEEISEGDISFPYRLMKGKADSRNAIKLLELLGYDSGIIDSAEKMAEHFLAQGAWT